MTGPFNYRQLKPDYERRLRHLVALALGGLPLPAAELDAARHLLCVLVLDPLSRRDHGILLNRFPSPFPPPADELLDRLATDGLEAGDPTALLSVILCVAAINGLSDRVHEDEQIHPSWVSALAMFPLPDHDDANSRLALQFAESIMGEPSFVQPPHLYASAVSDIAESSFKLESDQASPVWLGVAETAAEGSTILGTIEDGLRGLKTMPEKGFALIRVRRRGVNEELSYEAVLVFWPEWQIQTAETRVRKRLYSAIEGMVWRTKGVETAGVKIGMPKGRITLDDEDIGRWRAAVELVSVLNLARPSGSVLAIHFYIHVTEPAGSDIETGTVPLSRVLGLATDVESVERLVIEAFIPPPGQRERIHAGKD